MSFPGPDAVRRPERLGADGAVAGHRGRLDRPRELAPAARDYYAAYEAAALGLLTVRLNLMNNGAATPQRADEVTREVLGWIDQERALIKPAMPDTQSWFRSENLLMKTRVAANGLQDFQANDLFKAGWNASIRNGPGCDQLIRMADASGVPRPRTRRTSTST